MMRVLYLSHTGMTEPLGQTQVLPYVEGLVGRGIAHDIVSFEPPQTKPEDLERVRGRLERQGIGFTPLVRSARHDLGTKALEAGLGVLRGARAAIANRPDVVHARSYLPAAAADLLAGALPGAKLLFDCRGMIADEYVDAGHWREGELKFRLVKGYERRLFQRAEGLVVLTDALARLLGERRQLAPRVQVQVVPCCVDTERFRPDEEARSRTRASLGIDERAPVVVYSGTLGSWYREREMARFVAALRRRRPDLHFVVLTRADASALVAACVEEGVPEAGVHVRAVPPREMPSFLAAGDVGLSFIKTCFSKVGSSPTKVAEYLASGLSVVVNAGIGDQADLAADAGACAVMPDFTDASIQAAAARCNALLDEDRAVRAERARAVAKARYSLADVGVPRYESLLRAISAG